MVTPNKCDGGININFHIFAGPLYTVDCRYNEILGPREIDLL